MTLFIIKINYNVGLFKTFQLFQSNFPSGIERIYEFQFQPPNTLYDGI